MTAAASSGGWHLCWNDLTLSTHFYSFLILMPLALGEAAKWVLRKRPDWATILSIPLAFIIFSLLQPNPDCLRS